MREGVVVVGAAAGAVVGETVVVVSGPAVEVVVTAAEVHEANTRVAMISIVRFIGQSYCSSRPRVWHDEETTAWETPSHGQEPGLIAAITTRIRVAAMCLRDPQLRRLQLAWLGFNTADMAVTVALGVYAFGIGGATAVGLITLARSLPAVVSAPLFSVVTDRLSRRSMLAVGFWGRALITGLMALTLGVEGPLWLLYLLAPLDVILSSAVYPASAASIPDLSPTAEVLSSANAVFSMMENTGALIGPLLAAGLIAGAGVESVFLVSMALYLLAALTTRTLVSDRTTGSLEGLRLFEDVKDGLATLRRHWDARTVVIAWTLESMLIGVLEVALVVVALDLLDWGDPGVGLLTAVTGVGGIIGAASLASSTRSRGYGMALISALALFGLGFAGMSISQAAVVVIGTAAVGIAFSRADVASQTLIQRTTPGESLGRVLGMVEGLYWAAVGVGAVVGSVVIELVGPERALVSFAAAAILIALLFSVPLRRIDTEAEVAFDRVASCGSCSLFAALPVATVEYLANHAGDIEFSTGERIMKEGDPGDDFYLIVDGEADVDIGGTVVKRLGPGEYFGEIALLFDTPRTATVTAVSPLRVLRFDGAHFVAAVTGSVGSTATIGAVAERRLAENQERLEREE